MKRRARNSRPIHYSRMTRTHVLALTSLSCRSKSRFLDETQTIALNLSRPCAARQLARDTLADVLGRLVLSCADISSPQIKREPLRPASPQCPSWGGQHVEDSAWKACPFSASTTAFFRSRDNCAWLPTHEAREREGGLQRPDFSKDAALYKFHPLFSCLPCSMSCLPQSRSLSTLAIWPQYSRL